MQRQGVIAAAGTARGYRGVICGLLFRATATYIDHHMALHLFSPNPAAVNPSAQGSAP